MIKKLKDWILFDWWNLRIHCKVFKFLRSLQNPQTLDQKLDYLLINQKRDKKLEILSSKADAMFERKLNKKREVNKKLKKRLEELQKNKK